LGSPIASFDWSDVKAEGKVSYTLQIAPGNEFSSQVLTKEGLVDSEYALSKNDIRAKDSYSWRVKAVDEVGNESPWSEAQEFEVITMSNQTLILSLVIPVLFIGAIGAAGIIIWRKQRTKRQ
jgi:nitrate reductase NapE component